MLNDILSSLQCSLNSLSRKQRTLMERENELLGIAHEIVKREGFTGLTMERVAAASAYSKGTVYNHFSSKEDLIAGLAISAMTKEMELFQRAIGFDGNNREKLVALHASYALFVSLEPALSDCYLSCRTPAVAEKSSPERLKILQKLDDQLLSLSHDIVAAGLKEGELPEQVSADPLKVIFANWAIAFGANSLYNNAPESECIKRLTSENPVLDTLNFMLDGVGWKPLSSEFDYATSWDRAIEEVFPEEARIFRSKS